MEEIKRKLSRRRFLSISAAAAAGAVAASCGSSDPEVVKETIIQTVVEKETVVQKETVVEEKIVEVTAMPEGLPEPPLLADRVASGELPPVADRLPVNPLVVGGREAIGDYGGEVRMHHFDPVSIIENYGWFAERMLHYSDLDFRTLIPNVFESWEASADGTTYTLHMREGMRYSDGEPITTENVDFWWNDVAANTDINPAVPYQFRWGGENMDLEIIDDYTFKVTFAAPFGSFPAFLTRWNVDTFLPPKHYLSQYHANYADVADLEKMAADQELETWQQVFNNRNIGSTVWRGPEEGTHFPTVAAWYVTDWPEDGLLIYERNPYFWKVDQVGNQLPYFDNLRLDYVTTPEAATQKALQGELDFVGQQTVTIARYPLYKEAEAGGSFKVVDLVSTMNDRYALYPNHTLPEDPVLEELVRHPNFVKALSVAVDRDEINESLFFGLARPGQNSPQPISKYFKDKYATAWAQYDPDLANELLDEMGLDERDGDGWRLRPDGERLHFNIEHPGERIGAATDEITEMVITFWREVGVDATTKQLQNALYQERMEQGLVQCGCWHEASNTDMLMPIEMRHIPIHVMHNTSAPLWAAWWLSGREEGTGEVPPPEMIQLYDWYDEMLTVVDEDERVKLGQQIWDALADNPLAMGFVVESPVPLLFNTNMYNIPRAKALIGWDTYDMSTAQPWAFYYKGGERA